ncbi:hypothetical protein MMC16_003393 [Acarospora aff. strigata]|nr:hypothetical protein [Acarospora aff. strigata]
MGPFDAHHFLGFVVLPSQRTLLYRDIQSIEVWCLPQYAVAAGHGVLHLNEDFKDKSLGENGGEGWDVAQDLEGEEEVPARF